MQKFALAAKVNAEVYVPFYRTYNSMDHSLPLCATVLGCLCVQGLSDLILDTSLVLSVDLTWFRNDRRIDFQDSKARPVLFPRY